MSVTQPDLSVLVFGLFVHRITNLQGVVKQVPLIQPPHRSTVAQGAVQMRIKNSQSSGDRLSQSKSMVLQETDLPQKPVCRAQTATILDHYNSTFNLILFLRSLDIAGISLNTMLLLQELPHLNHW